MSKPVTIAPRRLAVAIACRPATPAPSTITLAGATVPAAVVIIGKQLARLARGEQGRRVAGEVRLRGERVHRLGPGRARDRLHREGGDAGLGQRPFDSAAVSGERWLIRICPRLSFAISSALGGRTWRTTSAPQAAEPSPIEAPASS